MNEIRLRHAYFRVDPIKNIVGQGDKLAYYIVVTRGDTVGRLQTVPVAANLSIANDSYFEATDRSGNRRGRSWLGRLFAARKA